MGSVLICVASYTIVLATHISTIRCTPAMESALTKTIWSLKELIGINLCMNKTTRNIFKSLLISALITCAISALYGVTSILLEVSTLENQSINRWTIVMMFGTSFTAFLYIEPITWVINFALLQRFQTSNTN
jgi:hypothetical protein